MHILLSPARQSPATQQGSQRVLQPPAARRQGSVNENMIEGRGKCQGSFDTAAQGLTFYGTFFHARAGPSATRPRAVSNNLRANARQMRFCIRASRDPSSAHLDAAAIASSRVVPLAIAMATAPAAAIIDVWSDLDKTRIRCRTCLEMLYQSRVPNTKTKKSL